MIQRSPNIRKKDHAKALAGIFDPTVPIGGRLFSLASSGSLFGGTVLCTRLKAWKNRERNVYDTELNLRPDDFNSGKCGACGEQFPRHCDRLILSPDRDDGSELVCRIQKRRRRLDLGNTYSHSIVLGGFDEMS